MTMGPFIDKNIPDLVTDKCPLGCNNCVQIYINNQTGHRIVCKCIICNHNKKERALDIADVSPAPNAPQRTQEILTPREVNHEE